MSTLKTYRAVLAGTGSIADAHVRAVEATQGRVKLVAAADLDANRVRDFGAKHQLAETFTDYATMLRTVKPDLVLVATPPGQHAPMSIAAMEAGAWVWCEKPLCGSLADLDAIANDARCQVLYLPPIYLVCLGEDRPGVQPGKKYGRENNRNADGILRAAPVQFIQIHQA